VEGFAQAHAVVTQFAIVTVSACVLITWSASFTFLEMQSFWKRS
jgi:hypothetical protein